MSLPYLFVAGTSYSGSTLLSFLLDAHPEMTCVGESTGPVGADAAASYPCSCGRAVAECPFWVELMERMGAAGEPLGVENTYWRTHFRVSRNRYWNFLWCRPLGNSGLESARDRVAALTPGIRGRLHRARRANAALARAALDVTGKHVFVDACKDARRVGFLRDAPGIDLRVLHLVRDVRGGARSFMKNAGLSTSAAAREWRARNEECERAQRWIAPERFLRLRYSDLCADPEASLARVARFVGLEPAPLPARLDTSSQHVLGNRMRLAGPIEIREDVSWQSALGPDDLETIAAIAGSANRRYGYDWP